MSVGKRVTESFEKMLVDDAEGALFALCAAIEETAKQEHRPNGSKGFKEFIFDNFNIISGIGMGHPVRSVSLPYAHPNLKLDANGKARLENIMYHVVRCGLYHEAKLPPNFQLTDNTLGTNQGTALLLPKTLVQGFIAAVVASPANVKERTNSAFYFEMYNQQLFLNDLWGKRSELLKLVLDSETARREESQPDS